MGRRLSRFNPIAITGIGRPLDAPPTPEQAAANIRHLVWDIVWFGVLVGTTINFLQVYVVRLGASSLLVGAVTYGPALVNVFWQLPAARLMVRTGWRMRWMMISGFTHRLAYPLIALTPLLVQDGRPEITVMVLILQAFPVAVANTSFLSMMADAMPADRMTQIIGWRMAGLGVTTTLSTLLAGQILQRLPFPTNYQLLFMVGWIASLVSSWHISQLRVPDRPPQRAAGEGWLRQLGGVLRHPRFGRFLIAVGVLQLAIGMLAPLLPLYWVRRLSATDEQISILVTVASAAAVLGSLLMRRTVGRIGRSRALAVGILGFASYPLLTSLSPTVWWLMPWAALAGLFNSAITVTLFDNLVALTPETDRTNYIATFNACANVALFAGPLFACLLAACPAGPIIGLWIAAAIMLLAGVMVVLWFARSRSPSAQTTGV